MTDDLPIPCPPVCRLTVLSPVLFMSCWHASFFGRPPFFLVHLSSVLLDTVFCFRPGFSHHLKSPIWLVILRLHVALSALSPVLLPWLLPSSMVTNVVVYPPSPFRPACLLARSQSSTFHVSSFHVIPCCFKFSSLSFSALLVTGFFFRSGFCPLRSSMWLIFFLLHIAPSAILSAADVSCPAPFFSF